MALHGPPFDPWQRLGEPRMVEYGIEALLGLVEYGIEALLGPAVRGVDVAWFWSQVCQAAVTQELERLLPVPLDEEFQPTGTRQGVRTWYLLE